MWRGTWRYDDRVIQRNTSCFYQDNWCNWHIYYRTRRPSVYNDLLHFLVCRLRMSALYTSFENDILGIKSAKIIKRLWYRYLYNCTWLNDSLETTLKISTTLNSVSVLDFQNLPHSTLSWTNILDSFPTVSMRIVPHRIL